MKFSELVRLLENNGFWLAKEKGSIRYYRKPGWDKFIRVDYDGSKEVATGTCNAILKAAGMSPIEYCQMIDLPYSLIVEATNDANFFGFYSPELEGFTGVGHSVEDCLYQARGAMKEHVALLVQQNLPVAPTNSDPTVTIWNEEPPAA